MPKGYGMGKGRSGGMGSKSGGGTFQPNNAGGGPLIEGTGKSTMSYASGNEKGGNYGKPIGDKGQMSKKGNRRTYQVSDRYK